MPKISQYPPMATLTGSEILVGDQASVTSIATAAQLATLAQGGLGGVDSGAVNAYVITTGKPIASLVVGQVISFIPLHPNTGASTANVNGAGVFAIADSAGNALTGGEIVGPTLLFWTGALWELLWSLPLSNKRTSAEITAGVTPTNYAYVAGDVRRYGADPTGVADSTSAIQQAVNWAQLSNNTIIAPSGLFTISAAIAVTGGITFRGSSEGNFGTNGGTVISTNSTTLDVFTVNTSQSVVLSDLQIKTSVVKTAGNGITITQSGANINRLTRIERCYIVGMATGIWMQNVANYTIRDCLIQDFLTEGIYHSTTATSPDLGDAIIEGNTIWDFNITTGDSCIRLDPGAAVNIVGNKLLGANYGVRLTVSQGPTGTLNIVGNSIEQSNILCIQVAQTTAAKLYSNVCISANELSIIGIGTAQGAISIQAGITVPYLANVTITGNVCNMSTTTANPCISVHDGNGISITGNVVNLTNTAGATYCYDVGGANVSNAILSANKAILNGAIPAYSPTTLFFLPPAGHLSFSSGAGTVAAGSTSFLGIDHVPGGSYTVYVPFDCYLLRAFATAGATPGVGQSFTYAVVTGASGGTATPITWVLSGAAASDSQDVTHVSSLLTPDGPNTGARIGVTVTTSAGAAATTHFVTVELVKAT